MAASVRHQRKLLKKHAPLYSEGHVSGVILPEVLRTVAEFAIETPGRNCSRDVWYVGDGFVVHQYVSLLYVSLLYTSDAADE